MLTGPSSTSRYSADTFMALPARNKPRKGQKQAAKESDVQPSKMRTAMDAINRFLWDPALEKSQVVIGYLDRFIGIKEKRLEDINFQDDWASVDPFEEFTLPQHRIQYIKYFGQVVWDKREPGRRDDVFGSYGENAALIQDFVKPEDPGVDDDDRNRSQQPEDPRETLRARLREAAWKREEKKRPNVFICFRVLEEKTIQRVIQIQNSNELLKEAALPPHLLHFTLLTMRLSLNCEEQMKKARQLLKDFNISDYVCNDEPIRLKGLGCFRERVLYAIPVDQSGMLTRLHEALRDHMSLGLGQSVLVGQREGQFVPHMTVAKLNRAMTRAGKSISPSNYGRFVNSTFANTRIRALHLCRMEPPGESQSFYLSDCTLPCPSPFLFHSWERLTQRVPHAIQDYVDQELESYRRGRVLADSIPAKALTKKLVILRTLKGQAGVDYCKRTYPGHVFVQAVTEVLDAMAESQANIVFHSAYFFKVWQYRKLLKLAAVAAYDVSIVDYFPVDVESAGAWALKSNQPLYRTLKSFHQWERHCAAETEDYDSKVVNQDERTLYVFDLDHTLLFTPEKASWERLNGKPWRKDCGSWITSAHSVASASDSLCTPGPYYDTFKAVAREVKPGVDRIVVLTGRISRLQSSVEELLHRWGICADEVILKDTRRDEESVAAYKARVITSFTRFFGNIHFYDDKIENIRAVESRLSCIDNVKLISHDTRANSTGNLDFGMQISPIELESKIEGLRALVGHLANAWRATLHDCRVTIPADVPSTALLIPFGSFILGRRNSAENDLDCCFLLDTSVSSSLESLASGLARRVKELPRAGQNVARVRVHEALRARCPRISFLVKIGEWQHEVDAVFLPVENLEVLLKNHGSSFDTETLVAFPAEYRAIVSDIKESYGSEISTPFRAMLGLELAAEALAIVARIGYSTFRKLLEASLTILKLGGLRGNHLGMIKTFQMTALLVEFLAKQDEQTTALTPLSIKQVLQAFWKFLSGLPVERWQTALRGVAEDSSTGFTTCNLIYLERLRDLSQSAGNASDIVEFLQNKQCASVPDRYTEVALILETRDEWKTRLALNAGLPGIVRDICEHANGEFYARGDGCVSFTRGRAIIKLHMRDNSVDYSVNTILSKLLLPRETKLTVSVSDNTDALHP